MWVVLLQDLCTASVIDAKLNFGGGNFFRSYGFCTSNSGLEQLHSKLHFRNFALIMTSIELVCCVKDGLMHHGTTGPFWYDVVYTTAEPVAAISYVQP